MVLIKVNSNQSSNVNSGTNDSSRIGIVTHQSFPAKEYRSKSTIEETGKGLKYVQTYL